MRSHARHRRVISGPPASDRSAAEAGWQDSWRGDALVVALVPLLTVAEQGYQWGWDSPRSVACFVVGGIGLVAFVVAEHLMGSAALIPLRIFRIRAAAVTIAASVIVGMAMFGGIMLLPLYMQIVHGASPTESGLLTLIVPAKATQILASIPPENIYFSLVSADYEPVPQGAIDIDPLPAEDSSRLTPYGPDGAIKGD